MWSLKILLYLLRTISVPTLAWFSVLPNKILQVVQRDARALLQFAVLTCCALLDMGQLPLQGQLLPQG